MEIVIIIALILVPVSLGLGWWMGSNACRRGSETKDKRRKISQKMCDLLHDKTILAEIRQTRTSNALEFLEFSLDSNVCELWAQLELTNVLPQDQALQTLKSIKLYREQWPRSPQGDILASEGLTIETIQGRAAETKRILKEL